MGELTNRGMGPGIYMEWTDADVQAASAQQASMQAQRETHENGADWQGITPQHRTILAAEALGRITAEEAQGAINTLEQLPQ